MIEHTKKAEKSFTFWVLLGLTIGYFLVYILLLLQTNPCPGKSGHWLLDFFPLYLSCHSINELGDALAGAFAPVAFLWLAGAVFIQGRELQAQREELSHTRAVMSEQVGETRASTTLFKEQTEILKRQQLVREQEQADEEFDERVMALKTSFQFNNGVYIEITQTESTTATSKVQGFKFVENAFELDYQDFFLKLWQGIKRVDGAIQKMTSQGGKVNITKGPTIPFNRLSDDLHVLTSSTSNLSAPHRVKAMSYEIPTIEKALARLIERLSDGEMAPNNSRRE